MLGLAIGVVIAVGLLLYFQVLRTSVLLLPKFVFFRFPQVLLFFWVCLIDFLHLHDALLPVNGTTSNGLNPKLTDRNTITRSDQMSSLEAIKG